MKPLFSSSYNTINCCCRQDTGSGHRKKTLLMVSLEAMEEEPRSLKVTDFSPSFIQTSLGSTR